MRRDSTPPPHTCGWSPHYRRTVSNDECERCKLEDELILDTQRFDQKKRARVYRPAPATGAVRTTSSADVAVPADPGLVRRRTFVAPVDGIDLDSTLVPASARRRETPPDAPPADRER
jgi:hypothetical protein